MHTWHVIFLLFVYYYYNLLELYVQLRKMQTNGSIGFRRRSCACVYTEHLGRNPLSSDGAKNWSPSLSFSYPCCLSSPVKSCKKLFITWHRWPPWPPQVCRAWPSPTSRCPPCRWSGPSFGPFQVYLDRLRQSRGLDRCPCGCRPTR